MWCYTLTLIIITIMVTIYSMCSKLKNFWPLSRYIRFKEHVLLSIICPVWEQVTHEWYDLWQCIFKWKSKISYLIFVCYDKAIIIFSFVMYWEIFSSEQIYLCSSENIFQYHPSASDNNYLSCLHLLVHSSVFWSTIFLKLWHILSTCTVWCLNALLNVLHFHLHDYRMFEHMLINNSLSIITSITCEFGEQNSPIIYKKACFT